MKLQKEKEEINELIDKLYVIAQIMTQLELYYSKSMSRALRSKIREAKTSLQVMQRELLEKDKSYIENNSNSIKPGRLKDKPNGMPVKKFVN